MSQLLLFGKRKGVNKILVRLLDTQEVVGSSPIPPIVFALLSIDENRAFFMS